MVGDAPVRVAEDTKPGWSRLVLTGRVTAADAVPFHRTALELVAGGTDVTLSCEAAEYLDVSAIQIVLCLGRELARKGKRFDVVGVPAALAQDFRLAGLSKA